MNLRARITGDPVRLQLLRADAVEVESPLELADVVGCDAPVPVMRREAVPVEGGLSGPAVILDEVATIWLEEGWSARRDRIGNLHLRKEEAADKVGGVDA